MQGLGPAGTQVTRFTAQLKMQLLLLEKECQKNADCSRSEEKVLLPLFPFGICGEMAGNVGVWSMAGMAHLPHTA